MLLLKINLIRLTKFILKSFPYIYFPIFKILNRDSNMIVSLKTNIVIEGYPRSGNTFLESLIKVAFKNKVNIAHHTHSLAQIKKSISYNLPTLVLIRNPFDTAISNFYFFKKKYSIENFLFEYYLYYKTILKYHSKILIINFEEIKQINKLISKIENKFKFNIDKNIIISEAIVLDHLNLQSKYRHGVNYRESYLKSNDLKIEKSDLRYEIDKFESIKKTYIYLKCMRVYENITSQINFET